MEDDNGTADESRTLDYAERSICDSETGEFHKIRLIRTILDVFVSEIDRTRVGRHHYLVDIDNCYLWIRSRATFHVKLSLIFETHQ